MHFWSVARPVLIDLLAAILFAAAFFVSRDVYVAVGAGIGTGIVQLVYHKVRNHPIGPLQWLSLGIVVILGSFTFFTHNSHFIMMKPSILDSAAGLFMATRDWLTPYLPRFIRENVGRRTVARVGLGWAGLMFVFAAVNAIVAFHADFRTWLIYATFVPAAIMIVLFVVQYLAFNAIARRNCRARPDAQAA